MSKIGLLLGSFNPIHIGHLSMASHVIGAKLCDKVLFVVAKQNPWKKHGTTDFKLRCQMVEAAIRPFKGSCELSTVEDGISEPSYSYKAIERLKMAFPNDELYLILGTDTIENVHKWKNFKDKILPYVHFIEIARRKTNDIATDETIIMKGKSEYIGEYDIITPNIIDTSSTMIRKRIMDNMPIYPFVTEEVQKIIIENNLYNNG